MLSFAARRLAGILPGLLLLAALAALASTDATVRALAALPVTAALIGVPLLAGLLVGVPLGMAAARVPRSLIGMAGTALAALGPAVPAFLAVAVVAMVTPRSPALAVAALALVPAAETARIARAALAAALDSPYVLAARGRGTPDGRVMRRHALPTALASVAGAVGGLAAALAAAAVPAETLFGLPGTGALFLRTVQAGAAGPALAVAAVLAGVVVVLHALGTVLRGGLDPRRREA